MNLINLAKIVQMAQSQLSPSATPSLIADDWFANFREKCRTCSDDEMATLWARILAGEANSPGSYSRKIVNILADMDKSDAIAFRNLCRFQVMRFTPGRGIERNIPLVIDPRESIYTSNGVDDDRLRILASLGFINHGGLPNVPSGNCFAYSKGWLLNYASNQSPQLGGTSFTYSGEQMSKLCLPVESPEGFESYLLETWTQQGCNITHHPSLTVLFTEGILRACPESGTISWQEQQLR